MEGSFICQYVRRSYYTSQPAEATQTQTKSIWRDFQFPIREPPTTGSSKERQLLLAARKCSILFDLDEFLSSILTFYIY
jgi:hypothetical protein